MIVGIGMLILLGWIRVGVIHEGIDCVEFIFESDCVLKEGLTSCSVLVEGWRGLESRPSVNRDAQSNTGIPGTGPKGFES